MLLAMTEFILQLTAHNLGGNPELNPTKIRARIPMLIMRLAYVNYGII